MPKVTTLQFAETASQIRTWPPKTRGKLVQLIVGWQELTKPLGGPIAKPRKPNPQRGKPDSDGGL